MIKAGKYGLGKTVKSLPLLVIAFAAWIVLLAGLAIAESQGTCEPPADYVTTRCAKFLLLIVFRSLRT